MIGDIIILNTTPPHVACIVSDTEAVCEDGVLRPYPPDIQVAVAALDFIQQLEKGVLANGAG